MSDVTREEFDELKQQVNANSQRLADGDGTLKLINYRLEKIEKNTEDTAKELQALKDKPARRWESVSSAVLQWVVTALLAFIAVRVGLA